MFKFTTLEPVTLLRQLNEFARDIWARLNGGITSEAIRDEAVKSEHLGDGIITDAKIDRLTSNRVWITDLDVDRESVNKLTVRYTDIEEGYIRQLGAGHIDADEIVVDNLHAENIRVGTINGTQIAQNTITGGEEGNIAPGTITGHNVDQIEADYIKGGDLTLGGDVNGATYNGRVVMKRSDGSVYGEVNREGVNYQDSYGNPTLSIKDTGVEFGQTKVVRFSSTTRSGIGIFAV